LTLVEVAHELHHEADVVALSPDDSGRRMFASRREVHAVGGALDLGEALRAAADCTDLLAESRTSAFRAARSTKRAEHNSDIV
jgi:hypothetical protein